MRWSLFLIKLQVSRLATLLKRDPNTGVFLWILQNLRTPISKNTCERLLLIVVIYCTENWIKLFKNQIGLLFLLKHKITLFYGLLFVFIRFITRRHSLSLIFVLCNSLSVVVIRCHLLYHLLSLASLAAPLVVTRCHSLYHSLSFVVPLVVSRCHSLSFVVTWCTTLLSFYKRSQTSVENGWKS